MSKKLKISSKALSHSEMVNEVVDGVNSDREEGKEVSRKDVKAVIDSYLGLILDQVQTKGICAIPGIAKIVRKYKPATKKRNGTNPFTGEPCVFKAKPETYAVKARPLAKVKAAAKGEL
jgi:nucleoid DNA-binding protein